MPRRARAQAEASGMKARRVRSSRAEATPTAADKPYWQQIVEIGHTIPDHELKRLPRDLSKRLDHYLYGSWLKRQ